MTNFKKILKADIANGPGFRTTIFFTGCDLNPHCPGCFNSAIWSPETGQPFTQATIDKIIRTSAPEWCAGLSILGGEPTASYNIDAVIELAKQFRKIYPEKNIWMWSGRYKEEIEKLPNGKKLLKYIDVLVDRAIYSREEKYSFALARIC